MIFVSLPSTQPYSLGPLYSNLIVPFVWTGLGDQSVMLSTSGGFLFWTDMLSSKVMLLLSTSVLSLSCWRCQSIKIVLCVCWQDYNLFVALLFKTIWLVMLSCCVCWTCKSWSGFLNLNQWNIAHCGTAVVQQKSHLLCIWTILKFNKDGSIH